MNIEQFNDDLERHKNEIVLMQPEPAQTEHSGYDPDRLIINHAT